MTLPTHPDRQPLVDLVVGAERRNELLAIAPDLPTVLLSESEKSDLELLACGAFSPVNGFMGSADLTAVLNDCRLASGALFPIPILLPVADAGSFQSGDRIALRDEKNDLLAVMTLTEVYTIDPTSICSSVAGTTDPKHPYCAYWARRGSHALAGVPELLQLPVHPNFRDLRMTPREVRARLAQIGAGKVAGFQTRNPIHRAHEALLRAALEKVDALLIHPVVAETKPGDVDAATRVRTYRALKTVAFPQENVLLSVLPLSMRFAGPREALWHAVIRRNYGVDAFIVGRDHASPGVDSWGRPFYSPTEARELVSRHAEELGIEVMAFDEFVYCPEADEYREVSSIPATVPTRTISGTGAREQYLRKGLPLPSWFTRPEIASILADAYKPKTRQGFCVWFTGLSGSGKTTTGEALSAALEEHGRTVTLLDGDVVRTHLSKGLGFSPEDRDTNIRRIGFVASEIVRHGGVAICAAISPFKATRSEVRGMMEPGHFFGVFVDTPLTECERRDPKGLYGLARSGQLKDFTGIDSPYEAPDTCEVRLDGTSEDILGNVDTILRRLRSDGFLT